jgi:hypothetical protein
MVSYFRSRVIYDAASHSEAKIESVLKDKPGPGNFARLDHVVSSQNKLHLIVLQEQDRALWSSSPKFDCTDTWNEIRAKRNNFKWWHMLWFTMAIPKHYFVG